MLNLLNLLKYICVIFVVESILKYLIKIKQGITSVIKKILINSGINLLFTLLLN